MQTDSRPILRFYGRKEISAILGVSKTKAIEILHMFEERGQMYWVGNKMKVKVKIFNDWLEYERREEGWLV